MGLWVIWFIGIFIVIGTRIAINMLCRDSDSYKKKKSVKIIINLLIIISIVTVGGIFIGKMVGFGVSLLLPFKLIDIIPIFGVLSWAIVTYAVGYVILGLYHIKERPQQILFVIAYIISIIVWSIPTYTYNRNIEYITQTVVQSREERKLLYFCNIPVQNVFGEVSGSAILGTGSISGKITTLDNLPYWYLDENGEGTFSSALATSSKIIFIEDNQFPYVEVVVYADQRVRKNHNNGSEEITTDKTWTEYKFYLPEAIMQHNLNK